MTCSHLPDQPREDVTVSSSPRGQRESMKKEFVSVHSLQKTKAKKADTPIPLMKVSAGILEVVECDGDEIAGVMVCVSARVSMEKVMVKIIYTSIQFYSLSLHSNDVSDNIA